MSVLIALVFVITTYTVRGVVKDNYGCSLPWASILVVGVPLGTSTNKSGNFSIEIPDSIENGILTISYIGHKEKEVPFSKNNRTIDVKLKEEAIGIAAVDVSGDYSISGTAGINTSKTSLNQLDIYNTPGASADVFLTLKTLPAFSGNPDVTSIAIRGGSPDEVLVTLNGLPIKHPFYYYNSTGGLFSIIDENSLQSVEAFAGILPPAYGGKMSGGIFLQNRTLLDPGLSLGLSMANCSVAATYPSIGGIWFSKSYYDLLAYMNHSQNELNVYPSSWSLQGSRYSQFDSFYTLPFFLFSNCHSSIHMQSLGYKTLEDAEKHSVLGILSGWIEHPLSIETVLGYTHYSSFFGIMPMFEKEIREENFYSKFSLSYDISQNSRFIFGGEIYPQEISIQGSFEEAIGVEFFEEEHSLLHSAIFLGHKFRFSEVNVICGFRPLFSSSKLKEFDPRILIDIGFSQSNRLRIGAGRMTQLFYSDSISHADHATIGIEKKFATGKGTLDSYYKRYANQSQAIGFEGLVQYRMRNTNFQIGVSWMKTQSVDKIPLDNDIPLKLIGVLSLPLKRWTIGFHCCWSIGKPYTPLITTQDSAGIAIPIWGKENSARLPKIFRLDVRLTHPFEICNRPVFWYMAMYNLTDHQNVVRYVHSDDYQRQEPIVFFPRMIFAGFVVHL